MGGSPVRPLFAERNGGDETNLLSQWEVGSYGTSPHTPPTGDEDVRYDTIHANPSALLSPACRRHGRNDNRPGVHWIMDRQHASGKQACKQWDCAWTVTFIILQVITAIEEEREIIDRLKYHFLIYLWKNILKIRDTYFRLVFYWQHLNEKNYQKSITGLRYFSNSACQKSTSLDFSVLFVAWAHCVVCSGCRAWTR